MSDTFQKEIPKARVNIALEVETNGAMQKKELPLKILAVGDFSNGGNTTSLTERKLKSINKNNLNSAMAELQPKVSFNVENKINKTADIEVNLTFDSFNSFKPDYIASQIPELNQMRSMRNLLRELKSNLVDNTELRKALEQVIQNQPELDELKASLDKLVPLDAKSGAQSKDTSGDSESSDTEPTVE